MSGPVATPRPVANPAPVVWGGTLLAIAAAGVVGAAVAWLLAKWLGLP